jgi:Protein of unknown function (DUF2569)
LTSLLKNDTILKTFQGIAMSRMCRLCGIHVPEGMPACSMCGSTKLVAPPEPVLDPLTNRYSTSPITQGEKQGGITGWLILVAIGLMAAPVLRVNSILSVDIPILYGDRFQSFLESHSEVVFLLYSTVFINVVLALAALVLNFLFYTRRKKFPIYMAVYIATTLLVVVLHTAVLNQMYGYENLSRNYIALLRGLVGAAASISYLLSSHKVKTTFIR